MAPKPNPIAALFQDAEADLPEIALDISHIAPERTTNGTEARSVALDLSGKPKVAMAIGQGGTGKTTLLRWICERALSRNDSDLILATVDPINRELAHYFPTTASPKTQDPAQVSAWLERLLTRLMETKASAAIDFGGGDVTLSRLVGQIPDLAAMMEDATVHPVALYPLSPRTTDLTPLVAMEKAGFQPQATALILNEGRADPTGDPEQDFAQVRRHSAYRTAIARGAVEIWMPRLHAAKAIEDRRIGFNQAVGGTMPQGRTDPGLGLFDRSRTRHWLTAMEQAFAPIASWLL
jgi:hypothetical protein